MTTEARKALESLYDAIHARVRELQRHGYDDYSQRVIALDWVMSQILRRLKR